MSDLFTLRLKDAGKKLASPASNFCGDHMVGSRVQRFVMSRHNSRGTDGDITRFGWLFSEETDTLMIPSKSALNNKKGIIINHKSTHTKTCIM